MGQKSRDGKRKEVEALQERFLTRTMKVNWSTPGYMIREEIQRKLLRTSARKKAWRY